MVLRRLFLICAVLLLAACQQAAPPPLRIGVIEWTGFYGLMRGQVEGRFAAAGLPVQVIAYPDNPTMNADLASGKLELGCQVWSDTIRMAATGTDLRAIGVLDWSDQGDVILASPGISAPTGLAGKRIACERINSFSHLFVLGFLAKHRVDEVEVRFVDLPAMAVPEAIASGRIDAGHTWGPLAEAAVAAGTARVLDRAGGVPGWITEVLAVRGDVARQRRPELARLLAEIYRLQATDEASATATRAAAARFLGKPTEAIAPIGTEAHLVDAGLARRLMHGAEEAQDLLATGLHIAEALAHRGQIPADFPVAAIIDAGCLP